MYEQFFGLSQNPFSLTPDPAFLYLTPEHREAIAGLTYAILGRKGITVLTGDAGTGKTTLLRTVMGSMPRHLAHFSYVLNPLLSPNEFFRFALGDFGIEALDSDKDKFLSQLHNHLLEAHKEGTAAVLVIDEAHRLSPELLEEIRLLANYETDTEKLLQILLIGQDELDVLLDRHDMRQIKQRVAIRLRINRLTPEQVGAYVSHRWSKAGSKPLPFDVSSLRTIAAYSAGNPRVVNAICDNALLTAFSTGSPTVSAAVILEVARDLHLRATEPQPPPPPPASASTREQPEQVPAAYEAGSMATLAAYLPKKKWPFRIGIRTQAVTEG